MSCCVVRRCYQAESSCIQQFAPVRTQKSQASPCRRPCTHRGWGHMERKVCPAHPVLGPPAQDPGSCLSVSQHTQWKFTSSGKDGQRNRKWQCGVTCAMRRHSGEQLRQQEGQRGVQSRPDLGGAVEARGGGHKGFLEQLQGSVWQGNDQQGGRRGADQAPGGDDSWPSSRQSASTLGHPGLLWPSVSPDIGHRDSSGENCVLTHLRSYWAQSTRDAHHPPSWSPPGSPLGFCQHTHMGGHKMQLESKSHSPLISPWVSRKQLFTHESYFAFVLSRISGPLQNTFS